MNDGIYGALAARVRDRRGKLMLSQQAVADMSGLTRSAIASIETGRQSVSVHHVYAIARALGLPPRDLLPDGGELTEQPAPGRPPRVELFVASLMAGARQARRKGV